MKLTIFQIFVSFASCACLVSNDTRCSAFDSKCQMGYFQYMGRTFSYTGFPSLGIPIIDPFSLNDIHMSILGLVNVDFQGEAIGIGKCIVRKLESNVEARYRKPELICDKITIRGHYKVIPAPVVGKICGWCDVHGEGNGTLTLENWLFNIMYSFKILKKADGQIYINGVFDKAEFNTTIEMVTIDLEADSIKMGDSDITDSIMSFTNNNWKLLMDSSIGKFITDEAAEYYYGVYREFFDKVPANIYFKDDLSSLV